MEQHLRPDSSLSFSPPFILALAKGEMKLTLSNDLINELDENHAFLMRHLEEGKTVYGVNTGFGPLVHYNVDFDRMQTLQENALQQLSPQLGPVVPVEIARLTLAFRIFALSKARSGVRSSLLETLVQWYNSGCVPWVRSWGSVGASGDLVPLSAFARAYCGEGHFIDAEGVRLACSNANFAKHGLSKLTLAPKEALALVNGTSFSLAYVALSHALLSDGLDKQLRLSITHAICLDTSFHYLSPTLYEHKNHQGTRQISKQLRDLFEPNTWEQSPALPQPPYSTRAMVIWLASVWERLQQAASIIESEMNAVDDNPLIDHHTETLHHGANFQGSYVTLAAELLNGAVQHMAQLSERQINRLLHEQLNGDFTAFLADEPVGLNSGLQGFQLSATSLLADIRTKGVMHSGASFPTNADNQDIVSMSANAGQNVWDIVQRLSGILCIQSCCIARAQQLKPLHLQGKLASFWEEKNHLLNYDYTHSNLRPLLDQELPKWFPFVEN